MSKSTSIDDLLAAASAPRQINPVTHLPDETPAPVPMKGVTSIKDAIDYTYLDPHRDESYFSNPVNKDDPYDLNRVNWDVHNRQRIDQIRNANQTAGGAALGLLNQAIVGEIIGGTIEGFGALGDLIFEGFDGDFENAVTNAGSELREWTQEVTPIFLRNPSKGWDPGSWNWWMNGFVSVASTLSLFIPAAGTVRAVGMVGKGLGMAGKAMRASARAGKLGKKSLRFQLGTALSKVPRAGGKAGQAIGSMALGGTAMRYMENYREAAETAITSYDKNLEFFQDDAAWERFLSSKEGKQWLKDNPDVKLDDPYLREKAAQYIAGHAAKHSFSMNFANLAFDMLQYGLVFGHLGKLGKGTRASFLAPQSKNVRAAQNALLKNPKVPKTRLGRIWQNWGRSATKFGAWSYSEGIEEQVNFISMQEGIRKGDIMAGNIGPMNPDWGTGGFHAPNLWDRKNFYNDQGGYWGATLFGSIGGGIFTAGGSLYNKKQRQAQEKRKIEELGKRQEFIQNALKKRQEAADKGDVNGVKEQNKLLAINLGLNAAQVGNVDLLLEQMQDENFDQMLLDNGIAKEDLNSTKKEIEDIVLQAEKRYRKYSNRIFGTEYASGAARAISELEMGMNMYSELIKDIDQQIVEAQESTEVAEEKSRIGANTKKRRELQSKQKGLKQTIERVENIVENLEADNADPSISKSDKEQNDRAIKEFLGLIKEYKNELVSTEEESKELEANSKETYNENQFNEEQEYLGQSNRNDVIDLESRKQLYKAHRAAAWKQLSKILSGNFEFTIKEKSDKVEDALMSDKERKEKLKMEEQDRSDIERMWDSVTKRNAKDAENDAIIADLSDLMSNPETTEDQIELFMDEHRDNQIIVDKADKLRKQWKSRKDALELQGAIDRLRQLTKEVNEAVTKGEDIKDSESIKNEVMHLINVLWGKENTFYDGRGLPLTKKEQNKKKREFNWAKNLNKFISRYVYGIPDSLNWQWEEIFDEFVPNVQVMWGSKIGVIYKKSGVLYFQDENQYETAITRDNARLFDLDMIVLKNSTTIPMTILHDGRTFEISGEYFSNLFNNPLDAIEYNAEDNVKSVTLTRWDGKSMKITTPGLMLDLARMLETMEAVKRATFTNLVGSETMKIGEYSVKYEQTDLFTSKLVARNIKTGKELTGKINRKILHIANKQLSQAIEQEINNLIQKLNESTTTYNVTPSKITAETLSDTTGGSAQVSENPSDQEELTRQNQENAEKKLESEVQSETAGDVQVKEVKMSETEKKEFETKITEEGITNSSQNADDIIETETKLNENEFKEETGQSVEDLLQKAEDKQDTEKTLDVIDSSINQQEPGNPKNQKPSAITNPTATNKNKVELDRSYPQAWAPQFRGLNLRSKENPLWVPALTKDGNQVPEFMRAGKAAYRIIPMSMLSPEQLEVLDKSNPGAGTIISLWYHEPRKNENNQVIIEGNRVITNKEKQIQYQTVNSKTKKLEPSVMVIYPGAVNVADIIDFDVANSPNTGVGTDVILRVEPNWEYFQSKDPNKVVITVRLASDPTIILSMMRGGTARFKQNLILRKNVAEALKGNRPMDIKAKISGKTDGFITNIKQKGKSIKQPLSILRDAGFDIVLGYGQNGTVRTNNSDVSVSNSQYVENGTIYIAMPSSSGRIIPVRAETSNLSSRAANKVISILLDNQLTEEERRSNINTIVQVYGKLEQETELALDNYRIKFPYAGKLIGLQIHPEGGSQISNFQKFIEGSPFKYILYNQSGEIESKGKVVVNGETKDNILRDSVKEPLMNTTMNPGFNKDVLIEYLGTKKYNIQGHEINTTEPYHSFINDQTYKDYLAYLSDPDLKIVTTDIPGGRAAKFHHSILYTEVVDDTTPVPFKEVKMTKQEQKEFMNTSLDEQVVEQIENEAILSIDDLIQAKNTANETSNDIDNIDEINLDDIKLRKVNTITGPTNDIVTNEELEWFKEKFGEQGLTVLERVKWIRTSKGINAWGFYQNGLVTIAREGKAGTAYWEAFRRVFDIHLSEKEKSELLMDASIKWGDNLSDDMLETKLAGHFMDFMMNEKDPTFTGRIKKFFKELMYVIKNFLGLNNSINRLFRNIKDTQYKDYTAKELNDLSKVDNMKFRQMYNKQGQPMPQEFVQEVVGNINHDLYSALQSKAKIDGVSFESYLKDQKKLDAFYESIRTQYRAAGNKILATEGISDRVRAIGENYLRITDDSLWGIRTDALNNLTSPGFKKLAIQNLQPLFGVKYTTYRGQEMTDDLDGNEVNDIVEDAQPQAQEKIHGINYYYRPVKDTLSKDVKIGLSFIESLEKGKILGKHRFVPFNDVYNYLALNLSNVPEGKVIEKLKTLKHDLIDQVLQKYTQATPAWQNKFVSHFNKQNISFKTLVLENNGTVKVMYTNRNGLERQIINDWQGGKYDSKLFKQVLGSEDIINIEEAKDLQAILEKDLVKIANKYQNIRNPKEQQQGKQEYMVPMMKVLKGLGITLPKNMKADLFADDSIFVSNLHSFMHGPNSFQYVFKNLIKGISPYMANNMEMGALGKLAKFVSQYKIDSYLASFIGGNRKSIYSINLNTFDSEKTLALRSDETYEQAINKYLQDVFYKPNSRTTHLLLDLLLKNPEIRSNFQLSTFDVIKEKGNFGRATAYDRMTENLSALSRFSMFNNSGSRYAEFNTGTKSDKGQFKFVTLPKIGPKNKAYGLWKSIKPGVQGYIESGIALLRPLVLAEYARISKVERQLLDLEIAPEKQIKNYHYRTEAGDDAGNGLKFMIFRDLNKAEWGLFDQTTQRLIHINDQNQATIDVYSEISTKIDAFLNQYVKNQIQNTVEAFVQAKAITRVGDQIHNINLPTQALTGKTVGKDITAAIVEFAVNDIVMKPYIGTVFGPDLAMYKSDTKGNPMVDAGKRQYQSITPGTNVVYNEEHDYGVKPKFKHAVLNDIVKVSPETRVRFQAILENAGVESKKAAKIAAAYENTLKTDAQGYTTLEFHKRMMESRGAWLQEHETAYNKYWSKGLLGTKAEQELLLDPLKTYYFGEVLEDDGHGNQTLVFKQIKHSTVPLLRSYTELFKEEGSLNLNDLRERMEATGKYKGMTPIDMINFESGIKVGMSGMSPNNNLDKINVEILESKYLRSPQIMTTKTKDPLFGSQFAKLLPSNILNDAVYKVYDGSLSGVEIKSLYNDLWSEKIQRSSEKLSRKIGYRNFLELLRNRDQITEKEFADGQLKFLKKVKNEVYQMLQERELPDNYFLALDIEQLLNDVDKYDYVTPMAFPTFAKRFENILLSLFKNNILKQRAKGMSAVQVADFGWSKTKELQIKANKKGGIYAEIALPYELVHKLGLKVGDMLENVEEGLLEGIGYRIPTQGKNSMIALKVVRILPPNMGAVIQLPAEITTIMGSDFDIDKMYLMFPELTKDKKRESAFKFGKYKEKQNFSGLSDQAVNQALFDISHSILSSKNSVEEILTPLDSDTYQNAIQKYQESGLIQDLSNFDIFTPAADMYLEKINKDAAMLIGLFSVNSTSHALAQDMDITIKGDFGVFFKGDGQTLHQNLSRMKDFQGNYISNHIKDDQNEAVDNAKNQRLGPAGVTVYNHGVKMLLNRTGVPGLASLDFINQPIIKEFQYERATNTNNLSDAALARQVAEAWGIKGEFENSLKMFGEDRYFTPSAASLQTSLLHRKDGTREHKVQQAQLLADFMNYMDISRDLSKLNRVLNPEGLKNFSRLSYLEQFKNDQAYLESSSAYIKIGQMPKRTEAFIKYGIDEAIETTNYFIPFNKEGFTELKRSVAKYTGQKDNALSQELIETVNSMGLYYAFTSPLSPLQNIFYDSEGKADLNVIKDRLFSLASSTVTRFLNLRSRKNLANDKFFGMLYAHQENTGKGRYIKLLAFNNTTKLDSAQKSEITDRWEQLLDPNVTKDQEVRRMAEALVLYSIITSGFISTGPNTFVDLVPNSYWSNKSETRDSLSNFFRKEARTMEYASYFGDNAARQIIRNIYKDPGLLMTVDKKSLVHNDMVKNLGLDKNNYFIHKEASGDIMVKVSPGLQNYVEYFKIFDGKWRLLQLVQPIDNGAIYKEIQPLGERYKFVEMVSKDALPQSINPGNSTKYKEQQVDGSLSNATTTEREATDSIDDMLGNPRLTPSKQMETKILDLENRLLTWLSKEFNISNRSYEVLKTKTGKDALGIADIMHKIIHLSNNRDRYTVPEETAHFFIDMLQNKALVKKLMKLATKTTLHGEVLRDYDGVYNTPEEFAKETAGKILGKYIVSEYYQGKGFSIGLDNTFEKEYRGFLGLLQRLWDRIKSIFTGESSNKELNRHIRDVFGQNARQILIGNTLGLDVNLLRESAQRKYYSIGSVMEDAGKLGEGVLNKIGKSLSVLDFSKEQLKELGKEAKQLIKTKSGWKKSDYITELLADSNRITEPTKEDDFYTKDGIKLVRVTAIQDYFSDAFAEEEMAGKIAKINRSKKSPFSSTERVLNLWKFLQEGGTEIHKVMEGLISGKKSEDIVNSINLDEKSKKAIKSAIPMLKSWVQEKQNKGSKLYAEVKVASMSNLFAGTIDVIEETKGGRIFLHDFKTKVAGKIAEIEKQLPSFKYALSGVPNTILNQYRLQLSLYKYILEEKGIKVDGISIQALESEVNINKEEEVYFESLKLPGATSPILNKLENLKPINPTVIKNVLKKINPESTGTAEEIKDKDAALRVLQKAKGVIKTKIDRYRKSGNREYLDQLDELSEQLDQVSEKEGIILFTKKALQEINAAHKRLLQLQRDDAVTARNLAEIRNYVMAYEVLDEMTLLAPSLSKTGYENLINKYVAPAVLKRQQVEELYKALGRPLIAEFLSRYSSKPGMTSAKLEAELIKASRDISYLARWMNALADSKMSELAMVDKNIGIQRNVVQEAKYNLEYGVGKNEGLYDILDQFEKHRKEQGASVTNYQQLFEPVLEYHNGKPTGFLVGPQSYEFRTKRENYIKEKREAGEAITGRLWNEFYEENEFIEDAKYTALMKLPENNPTRKFYEFFMENYKYAQSILPAFSRRGLMLPGLRKTPQEKFMETPGALKMKGGWTAVKEAALQKFTITEDELEYKERVDEKGDAIHYVPIHYSHKIGLEEGMLNPDDASYDLASALSMYYTMAVNNQQMNEILAELELTKELLKSRQVVKLRSGMPVINQVTGQEVTTEGVQSKAYERLVDYLNMVVYGERKKKGTDIITIAGKKVPMDKLADSVLSYNSLRVLALNQHAGYVNAAFGNMMNSIEAYAGQYFGKRNFIKAKTLYWGGVSGLIKDTVGRKPSSKIGLMNEYFNVLQHFDEFGNRIKHGSLAMRGMNMSSFFFMMTMGEHMLQSQLFMSMALQKKFTVSGGKQVSLWDAYTVENGKLILNPEVAEQFNQHDRAIFKEKVQGVYQRLHGIYNQKDRNAIQQYAVGRWVMQLRKWLPSGFQRRFEGIEKLFYDKNSEFSGPEWNERLESYVEGNYISAIRFMNQIKRDIVKLRVYTIKEKWNELETWQKQNVKRSIGETAAFLTLMALSGIMKTDDEEKKGYAYYQSLYTIKRMQQELLFFIWLPETWNVLKTPAASMSTLESLMDLVGQLLSDTTSIITGGDFEKYKRKTGKWDKGDPKIWNKLYKTFPFRQLWQPAKDKLSWFHLN